MAPRKESTARRATYSAPKPGIQWPKSLDGQLPFVADVAQIQARSLEDKTERFEALLAAAQKIERIGEIDKPEWDPPEDRGLEGTIGAARAQVTERLENDEAYDWDEARVWRELYELTYKDSEALRAIAEKLDDKLEDRAADVETHNAQIDSIAYEARRLQLDLNL